MNFSHANIMYLNFFGGESGKKSNYWIANIQWILQWIAKWSSVCLYCIFWLYCCTHNFFFHNFTIFLRQWKRITRVLKSVPWLSIIIVFDDFYLFSIYLYYLFIYFKVFLHYFLNMNDESRRNKLSKTKVIKCFKTPFKYGY